MNGVRLLFCHWLQHLKINCFTQCTTHALFSNSHSTHVIVIGCNILLLCTSIVKLLLLARCFSGQNFHNYRENGKQKLRRLLEKTSFLSLAKGLFFASHMPWYRMETDRIREEYQPQNSLYICYRVFIVRLRKPETDKCYIKCYRQFAYGFTVSAV